MYNTKKLVYQVKDQLKKIPLSKILAKWGRWLYKKKLPLSLILLAIILFKLSLSRLTLVTMQGHALGTHYHIQYLDRWGRDYQEEIDALLLSLENTLATYLPDSELSRFNKHDCSEFYFDSPLFYPVLAKSKEVYRNTAGAFDPTVLPLVQAWSSSPADVTYPGSLEVNTLREYVSFDYIVANEQRIKKLKEGVKLDLSGIAKGYAVDVVADFLKAHGIEHMRVALGENLAAYGKAGKRKLWTVDLNTHIASLADTESHIMMDVVDKAVAISSKQGCVIDPATGSPAQHTLLAAAVIAQDCSNADAYATAMMARGLAFAQELLDKQEDLAAFLLYKDENGDMAFYASPSLHMEQNRDTIKLQMQQEPS